MFSFSNDLPYLPFLPPSDDYAKKLLEARLLSTTHNACITTKRNFCAGDGFVDTNGKEFSDEINAWFRSINMRNDSAAKVTRGCFEDFFTWGNVPIELVRFKVGGKRYFFVYAHSLLEWRLGKPDDGGIINYAIYSKMFLRSNNINADDLKNSRVVPIYNPLRREKENWMKDEKGAERTLIWWKNPVTGFQNYGVPSAVASMIYQVLEYKGARYNLDNFENNMVISAILALKGNLSQDEATRIGREVISMHTGDGKRGRIKVVASEEGISGSDFHPFDTHRDGSFNESDEKWSQKVIFANEWDAVLAGLISPSTLGKGSGFLKEIFDIKNKTVIKPAQKDLMESVWIHIFALADQWLGLGLGDHEIGIKSFVDISGLSYVDLTPVVKVDEVREANGLPKDDKGRGDMLVGELSAKQKGGENVPVK